jgi:hypothetical protein
MEYSNKRFGGEASRFQLAVCSCTAQVGAIRQ